MKLTRLEINGFKSFAKKTQIDFESGITAIIGPNGSGKSNIADAVRWVLGEQSAKTLRGTRMEDVIFNGTEEKRPQAYCEVSLTFDNEDGQLPIAYSEVNITRRVYRSGESEYLINKSPVRLKDITELLRDTGIGKEGYSIIGQGRVEEILSNKSEDRRAAFEEAAGVMRYRARKEEAERKLETTRRNLVRLNDLLTELGAQIEPLEMQSRDAREYLKLRDELREIEINLFLHQYDRLTERIAKLDEAMGQLHEEIEANADIEAALSKDCLVEEEKERSLSHTISELQNKLLLLTSGVEARFGESNVIQERMANLLRERERLLLASAENEEKRKALEKEANLSSKSSQANRDKYEAAHASLKNAEAAASIKKEEVEAKEALLEARKASIIEAMNALSDAKSQVSRLEAIRGTLVARLDAIGLEENAALAEAQKLREEFETANKAYAALMSEHSATEEKRGERITAINEANKSILDMREAIGKDEQTVQANRSRIRVLNEMKRAHEGYYSSVRRILEGSEQNMELKRCIEGVVAELMRVPKEYEVAIEMALGSALQNIVTKTEQDAKFVIDYLRRHDYGRATMLPMSAMRPRLLTPEEREFCKVEGLIGIASDLVGFDERYRGIFENLLGRTVIVSDLDAGIAVNLRVKAAFRIATLQGDIINQGGSMTGGSAQKREFSLIGREREIADLTLQAAKLMKQLETRRAECASRQTQLDILNASLAELLDHFHADEVELAKQKEKLDIIEKYIAENEEKLQRCRLERERMHDDIGSIDEQTHRAEHEQKKLAEGNVATEGEIRRVQEELLVLKKECDALLQAETGHKVELAALEKEYAASENERSRIGREGDKLRETIQKDRETVAAIDEAFLKMRGELETLGTKIDVERKDVDALTDQLRAMEEERDRNAAQLSELRERRGECSSLLGDLRERYHRAELQVTKSRLELENITARIWDDYEITYENALPIKRQIVATESHIRADELKKSIRELGNVNIGSIEDYKNVRERFESLSLQYNDLTKAECDLRKLIDELVATMEEEFKAKLALIQQNFLEVFRELFGGGRAELVLSDQSDILHCDIDIIAQPPGKKLQLLSLLSGGERALTAIALLFSILKLKPTAFCILDEIESSLDEANLMHFARFVKNYARNTQFIIITHRKASMEVCDALYGVAMEEKGISKIVSARFSDMIDDIA